MTKDQSVVSSCQVVYRRRLYFLFTVMLLEIAAMVTITMNRSSLPLLIVDKLVQNFFLGIVSEPTLLGAKIISIIGFSGTILLWVSLVTTLYLKKIRLTSFIACMVAMISFLVPWSIQNLTKIDRPSLVNLGSFDGPYSFPSLHASTSMSLYVFLIIMMLKYLKKRWWRAVLTIICLLMPLSISVSRMVLNLHYFVDIVGGMLLSLIIITLYIIVDVLVRLRSCKNSEI